MDNKEKIAKASEILTKYDVGKNLTFLIDDAYKHGVEGVEWNFEVRASSIPMCYKLQNFVFSGHRFEILAMNKHATYDGEEDWSDFTLKVDDEIVLTTVLCTHHGEWSSNEVSVSPILLKQVKLGDWMKDLGVVCERSRKRWAEVKSRMDEEKAAKLASNIDLGDFE